MFIISRYHDPRKMEGQREKLDRVPWSREGTKWREILLEGQTLVRGDLGSWGGVCVNRWQGEGREGTPREEGVLYAQHLVPELMRGESWPPSQEGIHFLKVPHLHGIPGNLHTDGSLCPQSNPSHLGQGSGGMGKGEPAGSGAPRCKSKFGVHYHCLSTFCGSPRLSRARATLHLAFRT